MRFFIDENIRQEVAAFLKEKGHDILFAPRGTSDDKIILLARKEKRILLTHNRHFANILSYPPRSSSGIIRIKIHPPSVVKTIEALDKLLHSLPPEQINGHLIILEEDTFRIR